MVGRADTRHLVAAEEKRILPPVRQRLNVAVHFRHLVTCILISFLKQVVGDVVPVTERLNALAFRVGFTLVTDEKPFKIFTAVHIIIILMFTVRRQAHLSERAIRQFWTLTLLSPYSARNSTGVYIFNKVGETC